jgi:hypothetical protein
MRQNQKQTQQLPQNPQQQQMQMQQQQQKMMGPNGPKPMDKTMGNMQQMQNLPGQQNKQNQMVITTASFLLVQRFSTWAPKLSWTRSPEVRPARLRIADDAPTKAFTFYFNISLSYHILYIISSLLPNILPKMF